MKNEKQKIKTVKEILKAENRISLPSKGLLETDDKNWLRVKRNSNGQPISIPRYCRAKDFSFSGSGTTRREHFTIIDWPYLNETCSVEALPDSRSRFGEVQYNVGAVVEFNYKTKKVSVNGQIYNAGIDLSHLGNGEYFLSLPDYPHYEYGSPYLEKTRFALTWFFIIDNDTENRYFHTGKISEGCVTVGVNGSDRDIERWSEIAAFMSTQRLTNQYVGKLVIKGL